MDVGKVGSFNLRLTTTVVAQTYLPNSVRNHCVIELLLSFFEGHVENNEYLSIKYYTVIREYKMKVSV